MDKLRFDLADPVSRTLLIPLWARALEQREPVPLVLDPVASTLVDRLDYDWRRIGLGRSDLAQCVVRLREFDRFVRDFLRRDPAGTVVHLGCGLDTRFQRVDNGQVRWFDLDLPQVIALRRTLLPEPERDQYLAASAFDTGWMTALEQCDPGRMLFVAEAMLLYFEETQVRNLILELQSRFPGAELVCDVCSPFAARMDNLHLLLIRAAARVRWALRDPRDVETWSPGIRLVESFSYFDDLEPRMGIPTWLSRFPLVRHGTSIQRYELGPLTRTSAPH